jgi:hypothetical protein
MIRFLRASADLAHHLDESLTLCSAVDLVIDGDLAIGRCAFNISKTQIVRIPAENGAPCFCCVFPPNREDRPVNSGDAYNGHDPLSPASVQNSGQSFFEIDSGGLRLLLLCNPWGYAERCATWSAVEDIAQTDGGTVIPWRELMGAQLDLCAELQGDVLAFNALAGNSQRRLHLVSHRPPHAVGPYAVQQAATRAGAAARRSVLHLGQHGEYPIDVWRYGFESTSESAAAAADLIERWHAAGGPFATVTVAAALEDGYAVLYVTPRNRLLAPFGWPGAPAVMEVLGAGVTSKPEFVNRVRDGDWGHEHYRRFLLSLRPHGVERLY